MDCMQKQFSGVGLCTLLHFLVDGLCACQIFLLSDTVPMMHLVEMFLLYNLLAFLTQPIVGIYADRVEQRRWMLWAANGLLAAAVLLASAMVCFHWSEMAVMPVAILLGLGNSFFHVWGGKQVAVKTENDITALGMFVSTGAFGLAVGTVCHSWALSYAILLLIAVLSANYLQIENLLSLQPSRPSCFSNEGPVASLGSLIVGILVFVLVLFVMFRSYVSGTFTAGVGRGPAFVLLFGATSMLGKMAGGWMADRLGLLRSAVLMVVVAMVCYWGRQWNLTVLLLGLFMINCTMPITLYCANVLLRGHEGFAFGLLAAALIPGVLWMFL